MLKPISIIFLLTALFSISVSELTSNNHPRGIFLQASTSTTWVLPSLKQWLDKICAKNLQLPLNQRMDDFVLQDIAVETPNNGLNYTMLYDVLDVVVPYLPGGSIGCFKNIFVGTIDIQWTGSGIGYIYAVQSKEFRDRYLQLSKQVAVEFIKRYPQIKPVHWYITYESNLNYLTDVNVVNGYISLLSNAIKELTSLSKGSVMWSPTFWSTWSEVSSTDRSTLKANLNRLFSTVSQLSPPGVNWVNFQDGLGKASNPMCTNVRTTLLDVVNWYWFLQGSYQFASLQINEELFQYNSNCVIVKSNSTTQISNENFYGQQGVLLGAAWELRFWRDI